MQPFLLARILRYFSGNRQDWSTGIHYYAAAFCIVPLLDAVIIHWAIQTFTHVGMKVRVACCTLIYRKILRLSNSVLENETSVGQVQNELTTIYSVFLLFMFYILCCILYLQMVNFLSNDVNRLDYFVIGIHYLWIGPLQVFVIAYLTFREIGLGAITGMIAFLLCIPLQSKYEKNKHIIRLSPYNYSNYSISFAISILTSY